LRHRLAIAGLIVGLSAIGGALGAVGMWWFLGQASSSLAGAAIFIGWAVTLIGWFTSARLSEGSQERMFRHNLINTARIEIVKAIRAAEQWLGALEGRTIALRIDFEHRKSIQRAQVEELHGLRGVTVGADLLMRLEEYELLFDGTRHLREQLGKALYDLRFSDFADERFADLSSGDSARIDSATKALTQSRAGDIGGCLHDLLVWTQNYALSRFTGGEVPPRVPMNAKAPRVVAQKGGRLLIVENNQPWPVLEFPSNVEGVRKRSTGSLTTEGMKQ